MSLVFFPWPGSIVLSVKYDRRFALLGCVVHRMWANVFYGNFFFRFMTDMTTKWLNFVIHDQNFGNLTRRTWNFKRCTLYMTNFLGFEKSDMLTKMVEFSLHMTNFLGIWWIWHSPENGWNFATHDKVFRNLIDLTC